MKQWSLDARSGDHTSRLAECGDEFALIRLAQLETIQATILDRIGAAWGGASVYGRTQFPQIRVFRHFAKLTPTGNES